MGAKDICPVCGRGDGEVFMAGDGETGSRAVSHIACVERLWQLPHVCHRAEQAEAALAEREARRCETCPEWRPWTATGSPDFCCCGNEVMDGVMVDGCNPGAEFACNRWTARADEGSE